MIVFLHLNSINLIEVQLNSLLLSALQPSIFTYDKKLHEILVEIPELSKDI